MMIGIVLILFLGLILFPLILGIYLFKRSRKLALTFLCIPLSLVLVAGSWYVYESNYQFVKSTNLSEVQYDDIRVGDSLQEAIQLYGSNYYTRVEQGMSIIGYVDRANKTFIEFWHYNDEIYEIRSNL
ncbi:hypothetical protein JOC85_001820 [Bacillus mesophilus]|uniref:Uncharacterized protein n=1 Tax=Bacillus mesophilus TaxID=1808955 RepID=A0A6M0Q4V9_9BACI|nr:hypothetical protein [Bacillus mesophilus]MBM7661048.1 hypothetical protein [Bacillus mesophilus]NEY71415.1 hypothetical protein [Bacillus mesophilus]